MQKNKIPSILLLIFIFPVLALISSCNNQKQNNELNQKNKDIELNTKELSLLEINQKKQEFNASELYEKYNQSVFKIYVLNERNELTGTGTGFFIGNNGHAVTNYHVLQNANNAYIEIINGEIIYINFDQILGSSKIDDYTIFKLPNNKNFKGFEDYSDLPVKTGETVFTIGNPLGGTSNTISQGLITGQDWKDIQFSAPIDHGSSGSPLFNSQGVIVGLVWGGKHDGNLYRAIKINILDLKRFIQHNMSNYDESKDPNLSGPFMGEFSEGNLIWAIGRTKEEAIANMNSSRNIIAVDVSIDGNGAAYGVNKYHDPRYGQVEFTIFGLPESINMNLKIKGKEISSKDLKDINFDKSNEIVSMVIYFEKDMYISLKTGFNLKLFREFKLME